MDVKHRSLGGADLGVRVRSERRVDDGSGAATCGQTSDFDECITVFFDVPRPQHLLLVGSGGWTGAFLNGGNRGECSFSVGALAQLGLNSVTGVLDPGFFEIGIDCRSTSGQRTVKNTELAVAALGDG